MTLRTRLVSDLIFPLQERLKQHTTLRVRREMEASQYWPLERLESMRVERLRGLLTHAAQIDLHTAQHRIVVTVIIKVFGDKIALHLAVDTA